MYEDTLGWQFQDDGSVFLFFFFFFLRNSRREYEFLRRNLENCLAYCVGDMISWLTCKCERYWCRRKFFLRHFATAYSLGIFVITDRPTDNWNSIVTRISRGLHTRRADKNVYFVSRVLVLPPPAGQHVAKAIRSSSYARAIYHTEYMFISPEDDSIWTKFFNIIPVNIYFDISCLHFSRLDWFFSSIKHEGQFS